MKNTARILKLISDPTRLRILMLLMRRELCVCQIMGVLHVSQPLVSRNLSLLSGAGFLRERKEGKLVFYSPDPAMGSLQRRLTRLLKDALKADTMVAKDGEALTDCEEFQRRTGRCDMKTFSDFMKRRKKSR
jgi:ArsR family transcriptional regulator